MRPFPGPRPPRLLWAALLPLIMLSACDSGGPLEGDSGETDVVTSMSVVTNPNGVAPLTAEVTLRTDRPVNVEVTVPGRGGPETTVRYRVEPETQPFAVPIVGLYPAVTNEVELRFFDAAGADLGRTTVSVTTPPVIPDLPAVTIDAAVPGAMAPGFNLVSYFGHAEGGEATPQRAFMFDPAGAIRWYLDFSTHERLGGLFFDNGVERLANGNLYFGDRATSRIYEVDLLGGIVNEWAMPGYTFHHNVIEKPDGNFIATVNKQGEATVEDHVIEISRRGGEIVNVWDLRQSLDPARRAWPTDLADLNVDWFHGNAVTYSADDDAIIVSGRTQGTVKLTADNEVVWILAPHREWATAGDGTDLVGRLLQPLDAAGDPITDPAVLDGEAAHPDFEWPWYQHAPHVAADGTLYLFDNGDNREYRGEPTYSRAVAYRIDEASMTIQQVWQYGKERGQETYARIVSDVDVHEEAGTVVFMPGAVRFAGRTYGKVVEVDRETRQVVFEATIEPPRAAFGIITFHRVERLPLVPDPA